MSLHTQPGKAAKPGTHNQQPTSAPTVSTPLDDVFGSLNPTQKHDYIAETEKRLKAGLDLLKIQGAALLKAAPPLPPPVPKLAPPEPQRLQYDTYLADSPRPPKKVAYAVCKHTRTLLQAPTGAGKTSLLFADNGPIARWKRRNPTGITLLTAPTNALAQQIAAKNPEKAAYIPAGSQAEDIEAGIAAGVIVCTFDTSPEIIHQLDQAGIPILLVADEYHQVNTERGYRSGACDSLQHLIATAGKDSAPVRNVLCLTATPQPGQTALGDWYHVKAIQRNPTEKQLRVNETTDTVQSTLNQIREYHHQQPNGLAVVEHDNKTELAALKESLIQLGYPPESVLVLIGESEKPDWLINALAPPEGLRVLLTTCWIETGISIQTERPALTTWNQQSQDTYDATPAAQFLDRVRYQGNAPRQYIANLKEPKTEPVGLGENQKTRLRLFEQQLETCKKIADWLNNALNNAPNAELAAATEQIGRNDAMQASKQTIRDKAGKYHPNTAYALFEANQEVNSRLNRLDFVNGMEEYGYTVTLTRETPERETATNAAVEQSKETAKTRKQAAAELVYHQLETVTPLVFVLAVNSLLGGILSRAVLGLLGVCANVRKEADTYLQQQRETLNLYRPELAGIVKLAVAGLRVGLDLQTAFRMLLPDGEQLSPTVWKRHLDQLASLNLLAANPNSLNQADRLDRLKIEAVLAEVKNGQSYTGAELRAIARQIWRVDSTQRTLGINSAKPRKQAERNAVKLLQEIVQLNPHQRQQDGKRLTYYTVRMDCPDLKQALEAAECSRLRHYQSGLSQRLENGHTEAPEAVFAASGMQSVSYKE